jgi:hypothetical protein
MMLDLFSSPKRSDRLRATGWAVLVVGLIGAAAFYVFTLWTADPTLSDTNALGYQRSLRHGMGVMMGPLGMMLTEWQETLTSPLGETLLIAVGVALVAGYFFRVAWVLDADEDQP